MGQERYVLFVFIRIDEADLVPLALDDLEFRVENLVDFHPCSTQFGRTPPGGCDAVVPAIFTICDVTARCVSRPQWQRVIVFWSKM